MIDQTPHLFCFGLGYSASALAQDLLKEGWRVSGTHRPAESTPDLKNIQTFAFDRTTPLANFEAIFKTVTHVLISVPPDGAGCPVLDVHGADIAAHASHLKSLGYLSTVGVYGNTDGKPVVETSRLLPTQERSRFRGLAETRWQNLAVRTQLSLFVFRLAGIYGPGRSPFAKVRAGTAQRIAKPQHLFSRIHVDDIANVIKAAFAKPKAHGIYNVCDDAPAAPSDVIKYACKLLKKPVPKEISFADAQRNMSSMALSFWADNRLIKNDKIKNKLNVELIYPDYKVGLKAVLKAEA
ncbi:MAG: SDR family oxidoreductase [Magnetovibrio sp.]|nr:SDR family oxidoreductase [Magnetovibrio sp.]